MRLMHDNDSNADDRVRFATLVMRQLDNALTEDEAAELARELHASSERREQYVALCIHAQTLAERLRARALGGEVLSTEQATISEPESAATLNDAFVLPALHEQDFDAEEPAAIPSPMWVGPDNSPLRRSRTTLWAAGIAASVAFLIGFAVLRGFGPTVPTPPTAQRPGGPSTEPAPTAMIAGALDAEWAAPFDFLEPGQPVPAALIELRSGLVSIRFSNGVSMTVEGPARFEVRSAELVELAEGRVCADVPTGAHGFAVQTPGAKVVDLGTAFGVAVSKAEGSRVEVFEGKVELGSAAVTQGTGERPSIVEAGASKRVDSAGMVSTVAPIPGLFVRPAQLADWSIASRGASLSRWRVASERLRRDPSLMLYYTFDNRAETGEQVLNRALSARGRWHIPFERSPDVWAKGRVAGKDAFQLNTPGGLGLLLPDYPPTTSGRLSVAAWVYARSRPKWASIVKNRGDSLPGQFSLGLEGDAGHLVARITDEAGQDAYARQSDGGSLPIDRWAHVAFVADGQTLRLYQDGTEVGSVPCGNVAANQMPRSMAIGMRTSDDGLTQSRSNNGERWDGLIDELAVYHRALSPTEVRRLSAIARPD